MTELLRPLAWLEPVADLAKLGAFAAFVWLGLRARRGRREANALLAWALALSTAVGLIQHEAWPFAEWALVHHSASSRVRTWEMEAVDARGGRWEVDPAILHPLAPEEFGAWLFRREGELEPEARRRIAAFLLERAEAGRRRHRSGEPVSRNAWLLGPLRAPYHFLPGHEWREEEDAPDAPFVALRVWELSWDVRERLRGEGELRRRLLLESGDTAAEGP